MKASELRIGNKVVFRNRIQPEPLSFGSQNNTKKIRKRAANDPIIKYSALIPPSFQPISSTP